MPEIHLQDESGEGVFVYPDKLLGEGIWAEITSLLLTYAGTPRGAGVIVSPISLRLAAQDLGQLVRRHALKPNYDPGVRNLLDLHVRELRARQEAERDQSLLPSSTVRRQVNSSGRYDRPLTDQQIRNLGRLLRLAHGANFSVPGAGKTATLLAIYEALRGKDEVERLLIVAPKNAFLSWEEEIKTCYRSATTPLRVARLAGGQSRALEALRQDPEVALITYQFLPNLLEAVKAWAVRHGTHVVLDESHRIKGGLTGVYAFAALQLVSVAKRRDVLSGTPMPNAPEDLRAQMEFLWPGQRILPDQRLKAEVPKPVLDHVQNAVRPLYVRTTKQELQLPPLEAVPIAVELGPLQRELYDLLRSEARRLASGMSTSDVRLLRRLGGHVMKLLEAASNPMLLAATEGTEAGDDEEIGLGRAWELLREVARTEKPAKIATAVERAEAFLAKDRNNKVLLWTSFVQNVLVLERLLEPHGPVTLYGAIATGSEEDADTREGRIRLFHDSSECRVMIANPAACGEGISLHNACHYAIYVDRTFNAAHYLQSIDRIHRLGLSPDKRTRVEILEARGTIDSRVASRLKSKIESMSIILNDPGLSALAYDPLDVIEEFPAGIQPEDVEEIVDHIVRGDEPEK